MIRYETMRFAGSKKFGVKCKTSIKCGERFFFFLFVEKKLDGGKFFGASRSPPIPRFLKWKRNEPRPCGEK